MTIILKPMKVRKNRQISFMNIDIKIINKMLAKKSGIRQRNNTF